MSEQSIKIIDYNIKKIYRLPKKYYYLNLILNSQKSDIRSCLLQILNHIKRLELKRYNHRLTFFLSNNYITKEIRNKTTKTTTNHYINYLCCLGLLNKHNLSKNQYSWVMYAAAKIKQYTNQKRYINTFFIRKYTSTELEQAEQRAERLFKANVTPGNVSQDKLIISGLKDIAAEVYPGNIKDTISWKDTSARKIIDYITEQVEKKGYTTKAAIKENVIINSRYNSSAIDKVFKLYKGFLLEEGYKYKPPTQKEIEKYQLHNSNWIITK